jgi:hypothetical protein
MLELVRLNRLPVEEESCIELLQEQRYTVSKREARELLKVVQIIRLKKVSFLKNGRAGKGSNGFGKMLKCTSFCRWQLLCLGLNAAARCRQKSSKLYSRFTFRASCQMQTR